MESNIKGLVAAGHEMASELKAECGAVDMRSVAKLISDLATQLEVQLVRANALAAENAGIKSAIPESRDIEDDNDNMDDVSLAEDFGFNHAIERMRRQIPETPTTDAFLSEVRAQGVDAAIEAAKNLVVQEYEYKDFKAAQSDCCMHPGSDLVGKVEMTEWLVDFAAQLRKGGNQ
ncbi:eae-like domain protein [Escherichia coli]|uniref:eae-like domain protein n=1 Tax=Escherichia coli TaxID=562 RepID=UPI0010CC4606|nr:eae-like domain protein [Escherichia coli]EFH7557118.1 eae-like domain protein [Escherichia coli]EGY1311114.1 eae-like domain protein [Escherichia coli]EHP8225341.1 eae-like domain protein [Escherichia coli]ELT9052658.1 eae-like domain protein [Escherichia coli]MCO7993825.1 eae-like domain protein [Escherichia coli]